MNEIRIFAAQLPYYEKVDFGKYKMQTDRRVLFQFPKGTRVYDTDLESWFDGDGESFGGVGDLNINNNPTKYFDTINLAVASKDLKVGDVVVLKERTAGHGGGATWDVVLASGVIVNDFDIVQCVEDGSLAIVLRVKNGQHIIEQLGVESGADGAMSHLLSNVSSYDKIISTSASLSFSNTIDMSSLPYYTTIVFDSELVFNGSDGILFMSRNCDISIKKIQGDGTGTAFTIKDSRNSEISISHIDGWYTGVYDTSDLKTGRFNNRVTVLKTTVAGDDNATCLKVKATGSGFVNEEYFQMGYMSGPRGVWFEDGGSINVYNGNKLDRCQFEDISYRSVSFENCVACALILPRFEGGNIPDDYIIHENSTCTRMWYQVSWPLSHLKVNLDGSKGTYNGLLMDSTKVKPLVNSILQGVNDTKTVRIAVEESAETLNNTQTYSIEGEDLWDKWFCSVKDSDGNSRKVGLLNPIGFVESARVSGVVDVDDAVSWIDFKWHLTDTTTLVMPRTKEIEGHTVKIRIDEKTGYTGSLIISSSDGGDPVNFGDNTGIYELVYRYGRWRGYRISELSTWL